MGVWDNSAEGGTWVEAAQVNVATMGATWAANTFTTGTGVEWQVATKGQHVDFSDWSSTSTYTFATTPVVTISSPVDASTYASPVLTVAWTASQTQAQWELALFDSLGYQLEALSGSGTTNSVTFATRLLQSGSYSVAVNSRSSAGLWSDPASSDFTVTFPSPSLVSVAVTWDSAVGWALCEFSAATPVGGEVAPDQVDLFRSDKGINGPWELVAEAVPLNGTTITDTEAAVDGNAIWVARARNTTLGTEIDGQPATTEIDVESGYLSAGPGYELSLALLYGGGSDGPATNFSAGKPNRSVITLDGGTKPRRVLIETPEVGRKLDYNGRLYGTNPQGVDTRDLLEAIAVLDGPHLYRDPDGRKLYGALSTPSISRGTKRLWWEISFSIEESDHDMVVGEVIPS